MELWVANEQSPIAEWIGQRIDRIGITTDRPRPTPRPNTTRRLGVTSTRSKEDVLPLEESPRRMTFGPVLRTFVLDYLYYQKK